MTQLREQMIQDMVLRGMAPSTQRAYLQAVTKFARHYNRSPDRISNPELKAYLLYLHLEEERATSTCNVVSVALCFLYHRTLGRPQTDFDVPIARAPSKLPHVLSRDEVSRLLECTASSREAPCPPTNSTSSPRVTKVFSFLSAHSPRCSAPNSSTASSAPSKAENSATTLPFPDPATRSQSRLGRLREAPVRRTRTSACLSRRLHASHRHLEPPHPKRRTESRCVPIPRLRGREKTKRHAPRRPRVHPSLPAPRPTQGLRADPALRAPC